MPGGYGRVYVPQNLKALEVKNVTQASHSEAPLSLRLIIP